MLSLLFKLTTLRNPSTWYFKIKLNHAALSESGIFQAVGSNGRESKSPEVIGPSDFLFFLSTFSKVQESWLWKEQKSCINETVSSLNNYVCCHNAVEKEKQTTRQLFSMDNNKFILLLMEQ